MIESIKNRIGKFFITENVYEHMLENEKLRKSFWSNFVPLDISFHYNFGIFEIKCHSHLFDMIKKGNIVPEYQIIIAYDNEDYYIKTEKQECK